jgi:hypothetical protein
MKRRIFPRAAALALIAAASLRVPAVGRGETPSTGVDPATLIEALGDPAERVRFQAMAELMRLGRPATRELAQALLDVKPIARARISRSDLAFAILGHSPDVDVDALLDAYRSAPPEPIETPEKKDSAAVTPRSRIREVLGQLATKPTARVYGAFQSHDPALRVSLAGLMGRAGPEASEGILLLANAVSEDGHAEVRTAAALALAQIPDSGPHALRVFLGHADPQVRAIALAAYPADVKDSAELVASSLNDLSPEVRHAALRRIWSPEIPVEDYLDDYSPRNPFRRALDGEPAAALLAGLPSLVLPHLMALTRDKVERTRWLAIHALASLACARRDLAPTVVEALVAKISDPADEVANAAIYRLARLGELNEVSHSPETLDKLLRVLADPSKELEGHDGILMILGYMELPETRRNEVASALVTACLHWELNCDGVLAILNARPGWREAAAEALASRSFNDMDWAAVDKLWLSTSLSTKTLERFLSHPKKQLRVRAATALSERGYDSRRLRDVLGDALEEGARSFDSNEGWKREAAQALAHLGEPGVARLIAILRAPATERFERHELIYELSEVAAVSPQAADFLLATAAGSEYSDARIAAISDLPSLKSRLADLRSTLETAYATGNTEVRKAVVWTWRNLGQASGDLAARVLSDPAPEVRHLAFILLSDLPADDPNRLSFTVAALQDKDPVVQGYALQFAGELGEPGAAVLTQYAASGKPLTGWFFEGVERLGALGEGLVRALESRAADAPARELDRILSILGRAGAEAPEVRKRFYALLDADDPDTRERAAQQLLILREDPWAREGRLAAALMNAGVQRIVQQRPPASFDQPHEPTYPGLVFFIGPRTPPPRFPWPPPPGYRPPVVVKRELFGAIGSTTLEDVWRRLAGALEAASHGFEHGFFSGPPGGFAVVARMERIKPDGTPFPEPARWLKKGYPKLSLMDFLADLFFESPGYFRVIVFVVTSDLVPGEDPRAVLPEPSAGAPEITDDLTRLPFKGKRVLALVYSFERRRDAKVTSWSDGAPSALQHLEKAGVWARLGASTR